MNIQNRLVENTGRNKMREEFESKLDKLMAKKGKFAIWGAGNEGRYATSFAEKYSGGSLKPEFFVDNNPATWGVDGCISPEEFYDRMKDIDVLFIGVYVADQVEKQVRDAGFSGEVMGVVFTVYSASPAYESYDENIKEIESLCDILGDEQSIDTVISLVNVYRSGDISMWGSVNADSSEKCLDNKILKVRTDEHFVDIGAFTGDTVEQFLNISNGKYASIVAIEPEENNYRVLKEYIKKYPNVSAVKAAVGKESGIIKFSVGLSEGGHKSTDGVEVNQICLNEYSEVQNASLIKISTNGYELPVMEGATELIKRNTPKLSYYTWNALLWKLPKIIKDAVPGYEFYVRHYGIGLQGMIGYAVPK